MAAGWWREKSEARGTGRRAFVGATALAVALSLGAALLAPAPNSIAAGPGPSVETRVNPLGPDPSAVARASEYGPIVVAREVVRVRAGRAQMFLTCHNDPCSGVLKLVAQLGSSRGGNSPPTVLIARAAFSIAPETTVQRRIPLNRAGRRLVRRMKPSGRYVLLQGHGIRNRTLVIKRVRRFPRA